MPGPPPAGVSSTVRCLSVACVADVDGRRATRCRRQAPCRRGLRQRAGKHLREDRQHAGAPHGIASLRLDRVPAARPRSCRAAMIDLRHRRLGERQHQRLAAAAAAISIMSPAPKLCIAVTVPSASPSAVTAAKPDQVGVIEGVVFLDRRQPVARHVTDRGCASFSAASRSAMPAMRATRMILGRAQAFRSRNAARRLRFPAGRSRRPPSGPAVNDHSFTSPRTPCAAPMRATRMRSATACAERVSSPPAAAAAALSAAALAVAAVLAAASAASLALALLRPAPCVPCAGSPCPDCCAFRAWRCRRRRGSACTRSDGCAPFFIQALHLVEIELEPLGLFLRQQRIEIAEPLDEAAVARASASRRRRCDRTAASWFRRGPCG